MILVIPLLIAAIAGMVAAFPWFLQAAHIARRAGSRSMMIQFRVLAAIGGALGVFFIVVFAGAREPDSLSWMLMLHQCQFGPPMLMSVWRDVSQPWVLLFSVLPLWSALLSVRLAIFLHHAARRAKSSTIA